jgi:uncharacterized phiE125 gp8 family phage protein
MILTEVSPAPALAVLLDEFKAHLRLAHGFPDDGSEDAMLDLYLKNATSVVEVRTGKALIRRGFRLQVAAWSRDGHLVLPVGPVAAVDALSLVRGAESVAVAAGAWMLVPGSFRQRLTGARGGALPAIPAGFRAELTFDAGFGATAADVPGDLRQAVMLLAAYYHENRQGDGVPGQGVPVAVQALLETRRPVRI